MMRRFDGIPDGSPRLPPLKTIGLLVLFPAIFNVTEPVGEILTSAWPLTVMELML
jgi:hypothetical protein